MNEDFDQHEDDAALIARVGSAFDEGRAGRDAQDVVARGRRLLRRKRAVPAFGALGIVTVAVAASLAVGTGTHGGAAATAGATSATGAAPGHLLSTGGTVLNVDEAAFSVHTDAATGRITVTIRQFADASELQSILAKAGVHTFFTTLDEGECTWPGASVLHENGHENEVVLEPRTGSPSQWPDMHVVIDPIGLPSGSVLAYTYYPGSSAVTQTLLSREPAGCDATN